VVMLCGWEDNRRPRGKLWHPPAVYDLTHYGHFKTAQQRAIIQQYDDWYTGR